MAILSLLRTLKRDDFKKETARQIFSAMIETIAILAQFYWAKPRCQAQRMPD